MADSLSLDEFDALVGGKQPKLPTIDDVKKAAIARGINPDFAASIMGQESGGNWNTKDSAKGARGGMQVMPATFKAMMGDEGNPDDPWDNMEAGLRYIDYGRKKLGTDDPKLLAAGYHQGYDRPELQRGVIADTTDGAKRTRDYANDVARRMGIGGAEGAPREVAENPSMRMLQEWESEGLTISGATADPRANAPVEGRKDDGKGAVSRNLGYLKDNLKIGWNTLANAYDGLLAGQYAEIYEANKATYGENPTDPRLAASQAELKANYDAHMGRVAQRSQESANLQAQGRPETQQFLADAKDKPFLEQAAQLGDALVKNPVGVITDLGVQSAPASIAMMATAVAARFGFRSVPATMAGGGAASAAVEFGNDYAQQRAEGKSHEDAWTSASIKSGVVGLFDAASMGTAGKALDEVLKAGFGGKLKTIGKELGTQAALGGAGEGLGSLAAGDTPSLSAVAAEAVGEMFGAPGEALTTFRGGKKDAAAPADTGAVPAADVLGTLPTPTTTPTEAPPSLGADSSRPVSGASSLDGNAPAPNAALATPIAGDTLARVDEIDARLATVTDPQEAATLSQERARLTANWPAMALGRAAPFATETGANLDAQYAIVDAGSLTASHDTNLRQNPAYPQDLQPRDRERAASEVQISGIVQKLSPQRLGASGDAANGAPIVGADGLVESGNARTIALQRVYQANGAKAQSYRDWLIANADTFGFTSDQVAGVEKPVLVRVRRTPVNRAEFARQANAPTTAVMSTLEQARSDAARIQNLDDLETDDSGDFTGAGNRGFVRRFVGGLATTEQAGLVGADGQLSQSGYARIRNAVLARAYGDSPVLQRMVESLDNNLRNITGALMRVAPQVAKARDSIAAGAMFDRDITENLLAAVEELSRLRSEGRSVAEHLAQAGMFGDTLAPETADLLAFLDANIRSPKRIAEFLQAYLDVLASAGNPNQDSLFGGTEAPAKQDIINLAKERAKREQDRGAVPAGARGAAGTDAGGAESDDAGGAGGSARDDRTGTEGRARLSRKASGPPGSRPDEVTRAAPSSEGVVVSGDTITIDGEDYDATIEGFGQVDPPRTLADDDPLLTDTSTIDTPERRALRDRIVDSFFAGATPVEGRKPVLYLMGGGGGSGKGTIKKRLHAAGIIPEAGPVDLDADEIKVHHIPEYAQIVAAGDSRAAATVHEESSALGKRVQRRAMEGGYDLIVDGTMSDAAKAHALIDMARKAGYEIALFGVTVDPRAAIVRAGKRAKRSGRYVPAAALLKAHKGFASIFGELLVAADWGAVFDNTGSTPRMIARKRAGSQKHAVVNDSAYNEVVGYGGLNEQANRLADVIRPEARRDDGRRGRVDGGEGGGRGRGDRAGQGEPGARREAGDGGVPSERVDPAEAFRAALAELGDWVRNNLPGGTVFRMFDEDADPNLTGILVRLFEAAARLGYEKFERARDHVLKQLRASPATKVLANKLTDGALRQAHAQAGGTRGNQVPTNRGASAQGPGARPAPQPQAAGKVGRVRGGPGGPDLFSSVGAGGDSAPDTAAGRPPADGTGAGPQQRPGAGGGTGAGRPPRVSKRRPVNAKTGRNWRAGDADLTYEGSWLQKAQQNLAAVKLLRQLEAEQRQATPEEQRVLAKYVGWGASDIRNKVFTTKEWELTGAWRVLRDELKGLLTREQWNDASRSTKYAHYTDAGIVRGMWRALGRLGFAGGTVLEPGAGIGVFPGLMPPDVAAQSIYTGIEFESMTGGILRQLFPDERVLVESFIDSKLPRDFYDIAAGNPPFDGVPILADPEYRKLRFSMHDYFFAKTLDRIRPGGLLAFVTSHYTLDKRADKARAWMADRADLVGAIRLPQTAFQKNAGTEVVTDVIFLRKKVKGEEWAGAQPWTGVAEVTTPEGPALVNEYFAAHPEMVLGAHSLRGTQYSANEYTVLPRTDAGKLEDQFLAAVDLLPENVMSTAGDPASKDIQKNRMDWDPKAKKENAYYLADDGTLMQTRNSVGVSVPIRQGAVTKGLFPKHVAILQSYVPLRDALKQAQLDQLADGAWEASLAALQKEYRAFVAKHGRINQFSTYETEHEVEDEQGNVTVEKIERLRYSLHGVINDDPEWTLVAALEKVDEEKGTITEGPFLTDRVLAPPARADIRTPGDALLASLNDYGRIDIPSMAEALHMDEAAVIESLGASIYEDPAKGWQTSDDYLSGDVVEKLAVATEAARNDKRFERNVEALSAAQPRTITHDQITANIGQNWIPATVYADFMRERLNVRGSVRYVPATNAWFVQADTYSRSDFGTERYPASEILSDTLNAKPLQVWDPQKDGSRVLNKEQTEAAIEKAGAMRAEFRSWLWSDAKRAGDLQDIYNQRFNRLVARKFDGSHLTLPGTSLKWRVHPHVKRGAWRIVQEGNTYLAHAVGAGKTFASIISAMEQKRLGMISKPMFVVPNHMLQQFSREFLDLYPQAQIMVADEREFHTDRRRAFVSRAALTNLDGVVITHSAFKLLDIDPEFKKRFVEDQLEDLRAVLMDMAGRSQAEKNKNGKTVYSRDPTIRNVEQAVERLEQRLFEMTRKGAKDQNARFDEMGVDMVYVDEAHEYRKLDYSTSRQVKGIDPKGSEKAFDLYMKTRWLEEKHPGRSLVMMSGTPITNTMAEMYTVMRFLDSDTLKARGMEKFDAWAANFGEEVTALEADAGGKYQQVTRFAKFENVPELARMFRRFADVLTGQELGRLLPDTRPKVQGGGRNVVITPLTPEYKEIRAKLRARMEKSRAWKPSFQEPNNPDPIIAILGDGKLAAIDHRFLDPTAPDNPNTKLNLLIDAVIAAHRDAAGMVFNDKAGKPEPIKGATQMVFADAGFGAGVAARRGFDGRAWFTKRLTAAGIPKEEIAFMSDYKKSSEKLKLFQAMNSGKVRILVGSSKSMGTGVNAQQRLLDLHHMDSPWYPADLEQREGRIVRQGNKNPTVRLHAYAMKGTYDETMWGMVARKQRFIDQALSGDDSVRQIEDVSEASQMEQIAALTSGDPRALELAGLNVEIERLYRLYQAHESDQARLRYDQRKATSNIERLSRELAAVTPVAARVQDIGGDAFRMKVGEDVFESRTEAGTALAARFKELRDAFNEKRVVVGEVSGFPLKYIGTMREYAGQKSFESEIYIDFGDAVAGQTVMVNPEADPVGLTRSIGFRLADIQRKPTEVQNELARWQAELKDIEPRLGAKFQFAQTLAEKYRAREALEADMAANASPDEDEPPGAAPPGAPQGALLSRNADTSPAPAGLSVSRLRAGLSKILAEAKRLPAGGVQVVQSVEDLPADLRDFLRSENAESEVEGIYDPASKTVWLVADHLPTAERAEQVLFHELYGHFGLQGLFGNKLSAALRDLVARNRNLRIAAAKMRMEHGYTADIANEEALVELAERGESLEGLRRFVAAMQKALRELGFERLADWMEGLTDAEAMTVIAEARRFVRGQGQSRQSGDGKGARQRMSQRPGWTYSQLARVVAEKGSNAQPTEWVRRLEAWAKTGAVKADEVQWSGVTDWLGTRDGKVTTDDVLGFLRGNGVRVEEVMLGKGSSFTKEMVARLDELDDISERTDAENEERRRLLAAETKASYEIDNNRTKFDAYQLPGGANYREVLLTLPVKPLKLEPTPEQRAYFEFMDGLNANYGADWRSKAPIEYRVKASELERAARESRPRDPMNPDGIVSVKQDQANYRSPHWDAPNVLAHIRLNDRTDTEGRRVLFVEEIQSDWAQGGRKYGIAAPFSAGDARRLQEIEASSNRTPEIAAEWTELTNRRDEASGRRGNAVPRAPFVGKTEAWVALALKRVIRMAAEEGYEAVAFVTGAQSADRYDLSKTISRVTYGPGGKLTAYDRSSREVLSQFVERDKVQDYIGKDAAQRLLESNLVDRRIPGGSVRLRELSGLELKTGGEGMVAFYDRIVPNVAKDVLKKVGGGAAQQIVMRVPDAERAKSLGVGRMRATDQGGQWIIETFDDGVDEWVEIPEDPFDTRAKAEAAIAEIIGDDLEVSQPGFVITDTMREKAMAGVPLFSRKANQTPGQQADAILSQKRGRFTPLETITRLVVKATLLDRVTSGLYDRLLGLINRITPETVKAGVVSDYGVPEAVIDRRIQMQGGVKAGYRQVGEIIASLGNLTRAESRVAYQWMNAADPQSSDHFLQQLPAESVAVMADVEKWIDKLSAEAVKLGLLSQDVRDRHRFAYLRRSYLKHEEEATAQEKTRRRRAIAVLGDQYKGRGIVDGAPMRKIENAAPTWWKRKLQGTTADKALKGEQFVRLEKRSGVAQASTPLPGMPAGAAKRRLLDVVYWPAGEPVPATYAAWEQAGTWQVRDVKGGEAVMWRDFTAQEREQMGEIDEVKYAIARTLHGMIHDVEAARYLKWVADKHSRATAAGIPTEKIVDATESLRTAYAPDQWVQVPDTTIKGTGGVTRYGALAGRYLPAPIWNDIRQSIGPQQMVLGEYYQSLLRAWKVSKTALSPTVHVNNVMANFVMADWHDVRASHIGKALEILVRSKDPAHRRIIDRFEDAGGTIGTWSLSELQREQLEPLLAQLKGQVSGANGLVGAGAAIQLALSGKFREAASAAAGSKGGVATAAVAKAMIDLYQAEDVVFRMAAFIKAKEEGADDQAAAKVARKSFLDYQINAPWIQLMRQTAFPFVAFTYRAVPMLLETMAKRPWKLLKMAAVLGGLNALGYALSGGDEDKERKLLPEEKAGKAYGFVAPKLIRMPWNDDNDAPVFLDIRRWIPVGDVLDAGQTHSAIPILPVAVPSGPLAVFAEIAFNQSQFTGRAITKATDTGVVTAIANLDVERMGIEQESKVLDHLFKAFAPNIALLPGTYAFTGIKNAATGRTDSFGREQSVAQAVASSVGVKLGSYPSDVLLLNETRKRDGALREIQENISALKREYIRQGIGTEEYRKKIADQQAKMQKVNRDFAERVQ